MFPISGSHNLFYFYTNQTVGTLDKTLLLNISEIDNNGYGAPSLTKCPTIEKHQVSYKPAHASEKTAITSCPGVRAHFSVESDGSLRSVEAPGFYLQFGGLRLDTNKYSMMIVPVSEEIKSDDDQSMTKREKIIVGVAVAVALVVVVLSNIATLKYVQYRKKRASSIKK